MDFEQAPDRFGYIVFDRTDREANARRFPRHLRWRAAPGQVYMIAWQATLLDDGAVVRTPALAPAVCAGASVRATVKSRLRHHYRIVESG